MFNRYWREYPWFMQLSLFICMICILGFFFMQAVIPLTVPLLTGVRRFDLARISPSSPMGEIRSALLWQGLFHLSIFTIPALLFAYQAHPRPAAYLGLRRPGNPLHWLLAPLVLVSAMPLLLELEVLVSRLSLGSGAQAMQEANDRMTRAFLKMPTAGDFILSFFVTVILPAFGEELLFRGVMLRFAAKPSRTSFFLLNRATGEARDTYLHNLRQPLRVAFPIVIVAGLFALVHTSVYGLASIFLSGVLLGILYYWTRSLWCSILAHLLFNGIQVIIAYFAQSNATLQRINETNQLPAGILVASALVFSGSLYLLWKKRTPLQAEDMADYTAQEIIAGI